MHTLASHLTGYSVFRRAPGASATSFPRDDYDRMLNDISNDIENMGSAMDLSGGSDSILPKST